MNPTFLRRVVLVGVLLVSPLAQTQEDAVALRAGRPGGSLLKPNTLTTAFPLLNRSSVDFDRVEVTAISIEEGSLAKPVKLPIQLGTIPAGHTAAIFAIFNGKTFQAHQPYRMQVEGSYLRSGEKQAFSLEGILFVPPAAPGTSKTGAVTLAANPPSAVGGAGEPIPELDNEDNAPAIPMGNLRPGRPGAPTQLKESPPPLEDPADLESSVIA